MTRVAILQSNYLPWKGYFDIIHDVDIFVFYDGVQYTKNDWRNRNRIKTPQGVQWLTVPAGSRIDRLIRDVTLDDPRWQLKHWKTLQQNYSSAPYFRTFAPLFESIFCDTTWHNLSAMNQFVIQRIATGCLGIQTQFLDSQSLDIHGDRIERLIGVLRAVDATEYISGPSARSYISDGSIFEEAGIKLTFKDYSGYPEYPQPHPPFDHFVSIVDLLFQCGPNSADYVWGWRNAS